MEPANQQQERKRYKKKERKDSEATEKKTPKSDEEMKDSERKNSNQMQDTPIETSEYQSASESQSVASSRRQGKGKRERKNVPNNQTHVDALAPFSLPHKTANTVVSTEKGYTGSPENWWDEARYNKPKGGAASKANFDGADKHDYYFGSYSSHHIHEEMLKDRHRTMTYQNAIEGNPNDFKDKIVLDIGCGTGILSIFAARAGAKHVYAVDNAEIALFAREIVRNNGLEDKITVYKGKVEEINFPFKEGEVDIIISEWMGYFLLFESMLDCVIWARDKYLKKDGSGKMLPDRALMYVAAIEDSEFTGDKTDFWRDVYGVDMSIMARGVFKDPMVDTVPSNNIMSDTCCILDLDLNKCTQKDVEFANFYSLKMKHNDKVHAFVVWFDTIFGNLERPVTLTTSPYAKYTHWKQCVLYLDKPMQVRKGEELYGSLAVRQDKANFRALNIKMSFHMQTGKYQRHFDQQFKFA